MVVDTSSMHKGAFNVDFYLMAATVIPVVFLALTLQNQSYERIFVRWRDIFLRPRKLLADYNPVMREGIRILERAQKYDSLTERERNEVESAMVEIEAKMTEIDRELDEATTRGAGFVLISFVVALAVVVVAALIGELTAIIELNGRTPNAAANIIVLVSLWILLVSVMSAPMVKFSRIFISAVIEYAKAMRVTSSMIVRWRAEAYKVAKALEGRAEASGDHGSPSELSECRLTVVRRRIRRKLAFLTALADGSCGHWVVLDGSLADATVDALPQ